MATVYREAVLNATADEAWSAVSDVYRVHERLAPGFVADTRREGDDRVVTFINGQEIRELVVAVDRDRRRVAYAAVGGQSRHHHASMQVFAHEGGCRFAWITDVLPDAMAEPIASTMDAGLDVIRRTLEGSDGER